MATDGSHIGIGGTRIGVELKIKFLGLVLDARWNFREHFTWIVRRLMAAVA